MEYCVEQQRAGLQATMPSLGQFCIEKLGLQMRVGGCSGMAPGIDALVGGFTTCTLIACLQ